MTRNEMLAIASTKTKAIRRRLAYRSGVEYSMAEDCAQEGLLAVMEETAQINVAIEAGTEPGYAITRTMWRAASRFLYRNMFPVSKMKSLESPVGSDDEGLTWADMVTSRADASQDIERRHDSRRAAKAMEALTGEEIGILMAFADEVPLSEISEEMSLPPLQVLQIRQKAAEKVKSSMFSVVAEKLLLASIKNPASDVAKRVLGGVS